MMNKTKVIETLNTLHEEFHIEELIEKLIFISKVEEGLKDVENGKTMTLTEGRQKFEQKWSR